jgi:hypothetical protein
MSAASVNGGCLEPHHGGRPVLYDHGYLSSPNYPDRYFTGAECRWTLAVRRWQTIRITLSDFELDVKRAGLCHDYVEIAGAGGIAPASLPTSVEIGGESFDGDREHDETVSADGRRHYFRECGAMGRQVVDVDDSTATVTFVSGQTSSTQRGFFLYFEGEGEVN